MIKFLTKMQPSSALVRIAAQCTCALLLAAPAAHAADAISIGVIRGIPTISWPLHIANAKGFFAESGVKLDIEQIGFASNIAQQVTGGSLNMGVVGLIEVVRAVGKGADVAILREEGGIPPFILMAKPSIKAIAELQGKTISLGGVADTTRIFIERMLAPANLTIDQVDKIYAGSAADRFAQLRSGAVDAALLLPPFDSLAESSGFINLGNTKDYVKDLPFSGYMVNRGWASANKDAVVKFLAAYQKGSTGFIMKRTGAKR